MDREAAMREARRRIDIVRVERGLHEPAYDPLFSAMISEPVSALVEAFLRVLEERPLLRLVPHPSDVTDLVAACRLGEPAPSVHCSGCNQLLPRDYDGPCIVCGLLDTHPHQEVP